MTLNRCLKKLKGLMFLGSVIYSTALLATPFFDVIERETEKIQQITPNESCILADAYASRGESYLLLGYYEEALEDFQIAYEKVYELNNHEARLCALRTLIDQFFAYALAGDEEKPQTLFDQIIPLLRDCSCCTKQAVYSTEELIIKKCSSQHEPDYPVLGPDHVSIEECIGYVKGSVKQLKLLCGAVPKTPARVLALALIDQLGESAMNCCRRGGLWKGCLQKLVNKVHYWHLLGIPSDPAYYTGIHFM